MRIFRLAPTALVLGSLVLASTAQAQSLTQQKGFALDRFDPSDRGSEWFVLDSLDLRGHLRPAAGVVTSWAYKPLVAYDANRVEQTALVGNQLFVHPGASIVLWNRLRGGINMPIAVFQDGSRVVAGNTLYSPPSAAAGDLRLSSDVRLFGEHLGPITTALGVALYLPTGSRDNYTSDGTVRVTPRVSVAGDVSVFTYAARVGFAYRSLDERFDRNPLGSEITGSLAVGARVTDPNLVVGPEIFGSTIVDGDSFFKRRGTQLEWLLGAHYTKTEFRFGGGVGTGLTRGWGTPALRAFLGIEWTPGVSDDTDDDGIKNADDACPTIAGPRTNDSKTNGCPPVVALQPQPQPVSDRDGDGVLDKDDACPTVSGVPSPDRAKNGCPPDRDNDGVPDMADACPDRPGTKSDDPSKNGCPPDRDGDGIADAIDSCPELPGEASSDPLKNGCPPDRDGDGISDKEDACPDAQGPADPDPKHNGCPLARIEDGQIKIIEQVQFKTNSAELLRDSDTTLLAVATILKAHPELAKIRIEGHSDNRGKEEHNRDLSYRRALAVENWLVKFGIAKKRFESLGYGTSRPIASNNTEEGRETNRRVEFHITNLTTPAAPPTPPTPPTESGPKLQ
jgi:OmpA-OmpF porin, OOP family